MAGVSYGIHPAQRNSNGVAISVFLLGDSSSFVSVPGTVGGACVMWDKTGQTETLTVASLAEFSFNHIHLRIMAPSNSTAKGELSLRCCHVNMIFEGVVQSQCFYTIGTFFNTDCGLGFHSVCILAQGTRSTEIKCFASFIYYANIFMKLELDFFKCVNFAPKIYFN